MLFLTATLKSITNLGHLQVDIYIYICDPKNNLFHVIIWMDQPSFNLGSYNYVETPWNTLVQHDYTVYMI